MAATAQYADIIKTGDVLVSTANTNRDGTGTMATIYTARTSANGGKGAVISGIRCSAIGTTTAGMIRLFRHNGTSLFLLAEYPVSAITVAASTRGWSLDQCTTITGLCDGSGMLPVNISLEPGEYIAAATHNAESFHFSAEGGEF